MSANSITTVSAYLYDTVNGFSKFNWIVIDVVVISVTFQVIGTLLIR